MFVSRSWKATVLRILFSAVILFNALIPTAVYASPSGGINGEKLGGSQSEFLPENNIQYQSFSRPIQEVSDKPAQAQSAYLQTSNVLLQCDPTHSISCSNPNPGLSLIETFHTAEGISSQTGGTVRFKIQCNGSNCAPPDIYYLAVIDAQFVSTPAFGTCGNSCDWRAALRATMHFTTNSTWGFSNRLCGNTLSGNCHFEIAGKIPAGMISTNPTDWNAEYLDIYANLSNAASWEWLVVDATIHVSLDPHLLDLPIPADSRYCKGCYYGPSQGSIGDPINTNTGTVSYTEDDLDLPTSAGNLSFKRTYVSSYVDKFTSPLGYGWVHNQDLRLIFPGANDPGFVHFKDQSGNLYSFWYGVDPATGYESFTPYAGYTSSLVRNPGTPVTYTLTDQSQNIYNFDAAGKITSFGNTTGQVLAYNYDTNGRLECISAQGSTCASQFYLQFHYDDPQHPNQLKSVNDYMERSVLYFYDAAGDLDYFEDVLGQSWNYQYENHLLTRIEDQDSQLVERNEYYADGKAKKQFNGEDKLVAELIYNTDGTTTVKDALGNVVTHSYDARGTLTGDANYFGEIQKTFDSSFRIDSIQSPVGDAKEYDPTILLWSDDGANLEYIKDASSGETFIEYLNPNSPHVPTKITDPMLFPTKYYYNDTNFPDLPTRIEPQLSFDQGTTFIGTDYEYYPPTSGAFAGMVKNVTGALGNQTFYTYTPLGQLETITTAYGTPKALTTTYSYDPLGRLKDVTDEQGLVTHSEYDGAGRLTKTVYNVHPTISTQNYQDKYNITTKYFYDVRGNQIAVIDTYGTITRTYFDLASRPVTVVQNLVVNGTENDVNTPIGNIPAFNPSNPDRNIRNDTEYDDAGNVIVTRDPQGIITRTYYDEANRPKLVIQNWTGTNLYGNISTAPAYNPASPDENVRTEYFYDANGNLIATEDTLGVYTRTYYDELNRPVTVVQHLTGQSYLVDAPPDRGSESNVRTDTYYDLNGNVIATKDPNGILTRTYYDALNRPEMVVQNWVGTNFRTDPRPQRGPSGECGSESNVCSETFYNEVGNVIATVDPRGMITETQYDEANRPILITQNLGGQPGDIIQTSIHYDQYGRKDTSTDILGHVTKYGYNEVGQLVKVTANYTSGGQPQDSRHNIVTEYDYDALGRQTMTTDAMGRVNVSSYDDLGRLSKTTQNFWDTKPQNYKVVTDNNRIDRFNIVTSYSYDASGHQIAITDTKGSVTRTYFDDLSRPVTVVRNLTGSISDPIAPARTASPSPITNLRSDTVYLGNGNVDYVLDEMGKKTDYGYNTLGRLTTTLDPLLNPTSFEYDANGNRILMTDARDVSTKYEYDPLNRLKIVVENYTTVPVTPDVETNVRTVYTYDANGNRLSIRDGQSFLDDVDYRTWFTYDKLGRITKETDPRGKDTIYTYSQDMVGNIVSIRDAMLKTTDYHYDELDRLYEIDYPEPEQGEPNPDVAFTYDALGRRTSMTDGLGTTSWNYNNIDQPNYITDPFSAQVSYEYDELGNREKLTYPGGRVVNYAYNDAHRLESVSSTGIGTTGYEYDAAGRLKTVSRPNNVDTVYNYKDNGWLEDITHSSGAQTLASYQYQYYADGNRSQVIENVQNYQVAYQGPNTLLAADPQSAAQLGASTGFNYDVSYKPVSLQLPTAAAPIQQVNSSHLPLSFAANIGQFDKDVQFQVNALGGSVYFTPSEVVLALLDKKQSKFKDGEDASAANTKDPKVVRIEYKNAEKNPVVEGLELLPGVANFMVGTDKKAWVANAPTYDGIVYRNLYPGIDLKYEGAGNSLKSTFSVAALADPALIHWQYKEAGAVSLDANGNIQILLPAKKSGGSTTTLIEHAPIAWQERDGQRIDVPVQYTLAGNGDIGFLFPQGYDVSLPLTIDPTLTYSTYLGNTGTDIGTAITSDAYGNVYVTGYSYCSAFPIVNPLQTGGAGGSDIIISKISADGSTLLYSTCLGGSGTEEGSNIALDTQGRIVVTGRTDSTDFPIVGGISTYGGNTGICSVDSPCQDLFVAALNSDGSAIRYSTYLGGDGRETSGGMAVDANGKIVVVGSTTSTNFPAVNAYDSTYATGGTCTTTTPCYDVTVTRLDPELTGVNSILYSTYLGGTLRDKGLAMTLDSSGKVYLTGYSDSDGYPVRNALQTVHRGNKDIILSVIDPSLNGDNSLLYSTYLGSTAYEAAFGIARDTSGSLYLTGATFSAKLPLRDPLQYQSHSGSCGSACTEAFVMKFNPNTNTFGYSTYLGGTQNDEGYGIAVDAYGRAYVTGYTRSSDFPTSSPIQPAKGLDSCSTTPCADAFLSVLEPDGRAFAYSTFLGGDQDDVANGISLGSTNQVYLVGETYSSNFPTTTGAYDVLNNDNPVKRDAFITKISALGTPATPTYLHVDSAIHASSDDAEENASGSSVTLTSTDLELVQASTTQKVGLRFTDIDLPQGAVIQNAWIQFTVNGVSADATTLTIRAQSSDNAPTFAASANNISSRATTLESVSWTPAAWNTLDEGGPVQRTPNLSSVIQKVVDRPLWTPGNALAIIITGSGKRVAKSYDKDPYGAAYLHIEFTLPPPPGELGLQITSNPTTFTGTGQNISYTYTLTNIGPVPLNSPYTVSDDTVASVDCSVAQSPLPVGQSTTCVGTYSTTSADVTAGSVSNSATAAASDGRQTITSDAATATVNYQEPPSGPVTIDYVYDPLKRLTEANYSNNDYYHYTYDAVGNRKTQASMVDELLTNTTYDYDDANRLIKVNDVPYPLDAWDANGNLRNDGVNQYQYDSANRLVSFTNATTAVTYAYNGLGDRLQETVEGVTTTFTMDLNAGLTQSLSDGTNTYLYGNGRIAQVDTSTEYFLGDALGSVRQLTNAAGSITYSRAYDPYGVVTSTSGTSQSAFGYTSEYSGDSTQLLYLRARQYSPSTGRFLTRDTWGGDVNNPVSFNRWSYVGANPINRVDPSGLCYNPDGSWNWFEWPWFGLGPCKPKSNGSTSTPASIGDCYGDTFCQQYGQTIANRSEALITANSKGLIVIEPSGTSVVNGTYIPYQQYSPLQSSIPYYVCADVVRDTYQSAGVDLQSAVLANFPVGSIPVPDAASRNTALLQSYLTTLNATKAGNVYPYVAGEIVLLGDYHDPSPDDPLDGQATHAGVIVHGGNNPDEVIVSQASYSDMRIGNYKLREFVARYAFWVYHRDFMSNGGSDADATSYGNAMVSKTSFDDQAYRVLLHGHP